jgi:protein bicaudal C
MMASPILMAPQTGAEQDLAMGEHIQSVFENDGISEQSLNQLPPDWIEERFRVDRRKLEEMILAIGETFENGETFFQSVMDETGTTVTWPSKLKIGAKSKKDPHVKVCGNVDAVKKAKELILEKLDARSSRVTLKMDVPHTEHSHVIGKGGATIKKVMEETGCHIHFPDSNRSGSNEKSNQVSIAGEPAGVESARRKIRALLPIVLSFDLPKTGVARPNPDINSPPIQRLIQTYNISVQFRPRPRGQPTLVPVRGTQQNVTGLKDGITCLMQHLTGQIGATLPVTCNLEVAPQHQQVLSKAIRHIQNQTGARITLNGATENGSTNQNGVRRTPSPITITGTVDAVVIARHQLIEYLPLVLMCDMKENVDPEPGFIQEVMDRNDVFISIRPKPKQANKSVIIKSVEGNVQRMFEARRELLGLKTSGLEQITLIPSTANTNLISSDSCFSLGLMKNDDVMSRHSGSSFGYHSSEEPEIQQNRTNHVTPIQRPSPRDSPGSSTSGHYSDSMGGSDINRKPSSSPTSSIEALEQRLSVLSGSGYNSKIWETKAPSMSTNQFTRHQQTQLQHSFTSTEYARARELALRAMSRPVLAPEIQTPTNAWAGLGFSRSMGAHEARRALSNRAVAQPTQFTPTIEENPMFSSWRDSRTTLNPGFNRLASSTAKSNLVDTLSASLQANCALSSYKQEKQFQTSNFQNSLSSNVELHEVFEYLGLSKYTDVFMQQEVDLQTFLSLTDADLKELGITTFGPRRKMLLAIQELNKNRDQILQGVIQNRSRSGISCNMLAAADRW